MFALHTFGALSLEEDGRPVTGALSQKRKLALLAILAASGRQGVSRGRTALLLWPESDTESARHSLSQLLYSLRQSLSEGAVTGSGGNLTLDSNLVSSDVFDFDRAVKKLDREAAINIYRGPFLQGFHLPDSSDFEEWRSGEAEKRARQVTAALEFLARDSGKKGERDKAANYWKHLAALDPLNSTVAVSLMKALEAAGDRPGALKFAGLHESIVREQLGIAPDPAVSSLVTELRRKQTPPHSNRAVPDLLPVSAAKKREARATAQDSEPQLAADAPAPSESLVRSLLRRARIGTPGTAVVFAIAVLGPALVWYTRPPSPPRPRIDASAVAVLPFSYAGDSASAYLREGVVELMSANLDGAGELRAVNPRALLTFTRQSSGNVSVQAGDSIARHFSANFFLLGYIAAAGGRLRITGSLYERAPTLRVVARASVDGQTSSLFSVLDELTTALLAQRYSGPRDRLNRTAARTTYSVPALKAHLLGEQLFRGGRYAEAVDAFQTAVNYDSTFALAYYRLAIASEFAQLLDLGFRAAEKAVVHSQRLSEHDRNLVHAYSARRHGDADEAERLYEEILATHPDDAEAWFQLGEVLFHLNASRGRSFVESKRAWEHVLSLNPGDHFALVHLARVLAREGNSPQFANVISRSIATAPEADRAELRCFRAFTIGSSDAQDSLLNEMRSANAMTVWQSVWRLGIYPHDLNGAERLARVLSEDDLSSARSLGNIALMLTMLGRGRMREAGVYGARVTQPIPWSPQVPSPQFIGLGFSRIDTLAVRELRSRLMEWRAPPVEHDSAVDLSYEQLRDHQRRYLIGLLSLRLGDADAALAAARTLDTMKTTRDARGLTKMFATAIRADLALTRGKPANALRLLEQSNARVPIELSSPFGVEAYAGWLRAESLRLLKRDREALPWYASRVDLFVVELPYLGPAELRQAEIYERLGDWTQARAHYRRFLDLWKNADSELQPFIDDARAHLTMLERNTS